MNHPATLSRAALGLAALLLLSACSTPSLPRIKVPLLGRDQEPAAAEAGTAAPATADAAAGGDSSLTPRELLTARLVNPRANETMPNLTVGKFIEFADRYLACTCAEERFARAWQRTPDGYRLVTNASLAQPLQFTCSELVDEMSCYLEEIDRGVGGENLDQRFTPGAEFIRFVYQQGLRCDQTEPCP